jgi:hypothetical protein
MKIEIRFTFDRGEEGAMTEPAKGNGPAAGPSIETLEAVLDVTYTWGYEETRAQLRELYQKARRSQWVPEEVLDFSVDVDLEKPMAPEELHPLHGSDILARLTEREKSTLNAELSAWTLSQFLHGEQGALLAASQLCTSVPDLDSKLYGSTQVVDEGRHVDVYNRYLHQKVGFSYPVNPHLKKLLDLILCDSRWDMKLIGMQIMVEGLALAAFAMIRHNTYEPLLRDITRYVMADEARHVAFGVLALRDYYAEQPEAAVREREEFVYEAAVLMRDRFLFQEVWEKVGLPVQSCMEHARDNTGQRLFRQMLFAKIVPAVKKIGLLSGKLRERFAELGILQYENWADPFEELERAEG